MILDDATSEIYYAQRVEEESLADASGRALKELGGADAPGLFAATWTVAANATSASSHAAAFNEKFTVVAAEKGTAFRRTSRSDLDWIFTVQTERLVAKDHRVAIVDRAAWPIKQLLGPTSGRPKQANRTDHV